MHRTCGGTGIPRWQRLGVLSLHVNRTLTVAAKTRRAYPHPLLPRVRVCAPLHRNASSCTYSFHLQRTESHAREVFVPLELGSITVLMSTGHQRVLHCLEGHNLIGACPDSVCPLPRQATTSSCTCSLSLQCKQSQRGEVLYQGRVAQWSLCLAAL